MQLNEEKIEALHVVVYLHSIEKVISLLRLFLMAKDAQCCVNKTKKGLFFF